MKLRAFLTCLVLGAALATPAFAAGGAGGDYSHHSFLHDADTRKAILVQFLGFAILAAILGKFAIPPAMRALRGRQDGIKQTFDQLDHDLAFAKDGKKQEEDRLRSLETGASERMQRAVDEGAKLREQLAAEGEEGAARVAGKAKLEAEIEHQKMLLELRNEVVDVSFSAAEKVLRQTVNREVQDQLVERFLNDLETAGPGGARGEFTPPARG